MVIPASPVVPGNKDRRRVPEGTGADGVRDRGDPVRPLRGQSSAGVVGVAEGGYDPGDLGKIASLDIGKNLRIRRHYIRCPVRAKADMANRLKGGPDTATRADPRGI